MSEEVSKSETDKSLYIIPPSISTKSPYEWTCNEVCGWISSLNYGVQAKKFQIAMIDGSKLFSLNRTSLQNDVKVFDVSARNGILNEIDGLKQKIKEIQKNKVEKFAATHTRKEKKNENDEQKKNENDINDDPKNRMYIKIKKNNNTSDIGSNYTIQSILEHYDFKNDKNELIDINKCILKYCSIQKQKKNVFMFIICNTENSKYFYLFTKNPNEWNIENVFEFIKNISNHKFILFADELKRKKIDGNKLIKYNRKKLQNDYGNYFDSTLRKKLLDEINLLKQQMINNNNNNNDNDQNKSEKKQKIYHVTHKRTKSEIERDRIKKQKMRKAGPRDIGKIKYSGTKYDDSKDKAFLEDTIHPLSKDEKFQKRKKINPAPKKETVSEIGINKNFSGTKYDDSKDVGFLADRVHPLSNDDKFQKRKELNPATTKQTVSQIGTIKYDGVNYDGSNDKGFLEDSVHPLSKDERFQKRKELNPLKKKQTVSEIGKANDYKGPDWKLEDVVDGDKFLSDDSYYRQRSALITNPDGTVQQKLGPTDIGRVQGYKKPEWSDKVESELLASNNADGLFAEKIKKENKNYEELAKLTHKAGAVEVGKISNFDGIDYKLTSDDLIGGFLKERSWYDSSQVNDQFDEGISHLLKSLPSHKLKPMDDVPLPTGVHTKIVWLKKLRDIIENEKEINDNENEESKLRKEQLDQLNAMLIVLEQDKNKKNNKNNKNENDDQNDNEINVKNKNNKNNKKKKKKQSKKKKTKEN